MELESVLRLLEELDRRIAQYDEDIQDAGFRALIRLEDRSELRQLRDMVQLRQAAKLQRDGLVRLATVSSSSASSSSTVAREASEAERQAKEEAEQKAKAEAERKERLEERNRIAAMRIAITRLRTKRPRSDDRNEDNNE